MTRSGLLWPALTGVIISLLTFGALFRLNTGPVGLDRFAERVPGQDALPPEGRVTYSRVVIGEFFEKFEGTYRADLTGSWPAFRGADSTNVSREPVPLLASFSREGPPVLWRIPLGEGHAAPAIFQGRFFLLDYLETEKADALRCFSLIDGRELWRRSYTIDIKRNHGYSRTVPAVTAGQVVTIGPMGHVMCVETDTGNLLWTMDLITRYKGVVPQWYAGQCPLIDGNTAVLAPGGENALLVGVAVDTGEVLWETPNPGFWKMSHASVVPMVYRGTKMYVYAAQGGIVGVGAEGEYVGRELWRIGDWGATVVAPSPVILDEGIIYQSAGYGAGSVVVKLSGEKPPFRAEILHRWNPREAMATEQQTAIFYRNLLFGVLTKDSGSRRMMLVACKSDNPSEFVFDGAPEFRFGLGPLVVADDKFFALADDGSLSLLKFEENRFVRTGHSKILPGVDAWGPIAVADGLMLLRDSTSLVCLDMTRDARWTKGVARK